MALRKNENGKIYIVFAGLFLFMLLILFKLSFIQFVEGDMWRSRVDSLNIKNEIVPAERGNIYSADGSLLATSIPKYTISLDPSVPSKELFEENIKGLSDSLANMFPSKSAAQWEKHIRKLRSMKKQYMPLVTKTNYLNYKRIKTFPILNKGRFKGGLIIKQLHVREYPMGAIALRTIGYERINADKTITRKGIEAAFTEDLTGKDGVRKVQKMSKNLWKPIGDENAVEPVQGHDVITTLDVYIQDIAHHALLQALHDYGAEHGSVVVMETKTGHIKAISNLGLKDGKYIETQNYAVTERHDPGSTFKLASYLALLDDKKYDTASVFNTHGGVVLFSGGARVRDSKPGGYGKISLAKGLEVSSNTVVTQAVNNAYKDNPKKFIDKLESYGFNKKLGIELIGEPASFIPKPGDRQWSKIALPWMAYGYGIMVTPLQILTLYNAVANNGVMVKPQFVKEIRDVDKSIKVFDTQVMNPKIASDKTIKEVQDILKNVVRRGTGKKLYSADFPMAGKTGTAQMNYGKGTSIYYASSFVGYFPADEPKYSCIVVIHRPTLNSYYGADVAGPVFKRIAQKVYTDVPSVLQIKFPDKPIKREQDNYNNYYKKVKQTAKVVPNVEGMPAMDAIAILENIGLQVHAFGSGKVVSQSLPSGSRFVNNQLITIELK